MAAEPITDRELVSRVAQTMRRHAASGTLPSEGVLRVWAEMLETVAERMPLPATPPTWWGGRRVLRLIRGGAALALALLVATGARAASPSGLYALGQVDRPVPALPLFVGGVTISATWAVTEPRPRVYDWTRIDAGVAEAQALGRQAMIGITPGARSPAWLYGIGAKSLSFTWGLGWGFPLCSVQRTPLPWDGVYLREWGAFVAALGARYGANPAVAGVKVGGINGATLEMFLPAGVAANCPGSLNATTAWARAGYSASRVSAAWGRIVAAYTAAFPATVLVLQTVPGGPLGDRAQGVALMRQFVAGAGARAMLENDGLNAVWHWPAPFGGVAIGAQAAGPITGDRRCRMAHGGSCAPSVVLAGTLAQAHGLAFVELYLPDVANPAFAAALAGR